MATITVLVVAGLFSAVALFWRGRRSSGLRRTAIAIAAFSLFLAVAQEAVPRFVLSQGIAVPCTGGKIIASTPPVPIAYQSLVGGVRVDAHLSAADARQMVHTMISETPLKNVHVELVHGAVTVAGDITSPLGAIPASMDVGPTDADDGPLELAPRHLRVAGQEVPVSLLAEAGGTNGFPPLSAGPGSPEDTSSPASCLPGDSRGPGELSGTLRNLTIDPAGIDVSLRL